MQKSFGKIILVVTSFNKLMIMTLIIIFIVLVCFYQIQSYRRMYQYVAGELAKPVSSNIVPRAAVILPCKGLDPDFKENLDKLVAQDYGCPD